MFCSNCGMQNNPGEMFCGKCGARLDNSFQNQQAMNYVPQQNGNMQYSNNMGQLNPNYINKAVNPNMKKWAVLSIIVPVIAIIWYCFIGLSFYIAIFISAAGFSFAQKGEVASKKMATIGKILNGILAGMAIVTLALILINMFLN